MRKNGLLIQDYLLRFKQGIKNGDIVVLYWPPLNQQSARWVIIYGEFYANFTFARGRYPSQRKEGVGFKQLSRYMPTDYASIPVPMRHALAGWLWCKTGGHP